MNRYKKHSINSPQSSTQLKTFIFASSPDPYIKNNNGNAFLRFGMKNEETCKIIITANGFINSFQTPISERTEYSIPIPEYSDFYIEIIPDISIFSNPS